MTVTTRPVRYEHDGVTLEGVFAVDDAKRGPRPVVLVAHAWAGRTEFEVDTARRLAALGYAGFALDLYGAGVTGSTNEECQKLMTPFLENRAKLRARLLRTVEAATAAPEADATRAAALGFCFGGLCVLDLARAGAPLKGVASFHGLFTPPAGLAIAKPMTTKVAAFHGWDDPMATPEAVIALAKELTDAGADWQLHAYGGVMHAFTNPKANDPSFGTVYNRAAADRSWTSLLAFLDDCFG